MEIRPLGIPGVFEIRQKPLRDPRGYFLRIYDESLFREMGLNRQWVQENLSFNRKKGTVRGLHLQLPPGTETKLVHVAWGQIWDVFVDLRADSPTYGFWEALEISARQANMVFLPRGLAHGYCTLSPESVVVYKVDHRYEPDRECGLLWNDPQLAIPWPVTAPILSDKDKKNLSLAEFQKKYPRLIYQETKPGADR